MNIPTQNKDKPDWMLNCTCVALTIASSFIGLGGSLFLIFWIGLIVGVSSKSRKIRWAALCSAASAFATVLWVLR